MQNADEENGDLNNNSECLEASEAEEASNKSKAREAPPDNEIDKTQFWNAQIKTSRESRKRKCLEIAWLASTKGSGLLKVMANKWDHFFS